MDTFTVILAFDLFMKFCLEAKVLYKSRLFHFKKLSIYQIFLKLLCMYCLKQLRCPPWEVCPSKPTRKTSTCKGCLSTATRVNLAQMVYRDSECQGFLQSKIRAISLQPETALQLDSVITMRLFMHICCMRTLRVNNWWNSWCW